jgi:hypothetical protein
MPAGIVDALELTATEFKALTRNPEIQEQWKQTSTQDDSLVTFLDLELADGQCIFLTNEMRVELQSEEQWKQAGYPLNGSSLCFPMRAGGVAVLNLTNLTRLTFFPKPVHSFAEAWQARLINSQPLPPAASPYVIK